MKILELINEDITHYHCIDENEKLYLLNKMLDSHLFIINENKLILFDKFI